MFYAAANTVDSPEVMSRPKESRRPPKPEYRKPLIPRQMVKEFNAGEREIMMKAISASTSGQGILACEHLTVRKFIHKGRGLVATQHIPEGTFMGTYPGDLLTKELGDARDVNYIAEGAGCYLFYFESFVTSSLRNHFFEQFGTVERKNQIKVCLDPTVFDLSDKNNWMALINHSAQRRNLRPEVCVSMNGIPFVCFFTVSDIYISSEILFDYGDHRRSTPEWFRNS